MGSRIASCLVGFVITFCNEVINIMSLKLRQFGFSRSSFKSPTNPRCLVTSRAFSILILKLLKNVASEVTDYKISQSSMYYA